jgi:hypothetical protein
VPYNGPYNKLTAINALLAQLQQGAANNIIVNINLFYHIDFQDLILQLAMILVAVVCQFQ